MYKLNFIKIEAYDNNNQIIPNIIGLVEENELKFIGIDTSKGASDIEYIEKMIISTDYIDVETNQSIKIKTLGETLFVLEKSKLEELTCKNIRIPINHLFIENGITNISNGTFMDSTIKNITWPKNIYVIPESAFSSSLLLEKIEGIDNVYMIGDCAFSGCKNLKSFTWPYRCSRISSACFNGCTNLTEFICETPNLDIEGLAFYNSGLKEFNGSNLLTLRFENNSFPPECKINKPVYDMGTEHHSINLNNIINKSKNK